LKRYLKKRTEGILALKQGILTAIQDNKEVEVVLLKNFFPKYYDVWHIEGAITKWLDFTRYIYSGREILSVKNGVLFYKGPLDKLPRNRPSGSGGLRPPVDNRKVEILFLDYETKIPRQYKEFVDIERKENLFQAIMVKSDKQKELFQDDRFRVILKNTKKANKLIIEFSTVIRADILKALILDDRDVGDYTVDKNNIVLDVSRITGQRKYFFLELSLKNKRMLKNIKRVFLQE